MNEDFVSFDLAKKLKEKGFPQYTEKSYFVGDHKKRMCSVGTFLHVHTQNTEHLIAAPTISQVLKWLREAKRIDAGAVWDNRDGKWVGYINEMDMPDLVGEYVLPNTYDAYEQAVLACIEHVIDNLI